MSPTDKSDDERHDESQGAGRSTGSLPLGLRTRARRLYRARRQRLLEVPVAELRRRYGDVVDLDEEYFNQARVELDDMVIEVGFSGTYKMFGALIDTQWVARRGDPDRAAITLTYRFDRSQFVVKRGAGTEAAEKLSDATTRRLAAASELKALEVRDSPPGDGPGGRMVTITPLPGTITAVYFPPMPPYTVMIKPNEARHQLDLLLHLIQA